MLVTACAGMALASLNLMAVNLALPSLATHLHERSLADLSWVLNAYKKPPDWRHFLHRLQFP